MYKITFYNGDDVLTYNAEKNLLYKNNKLLKVKNSFNEEKFMKENDNYNIRITLGRNCNLCYVYCIQNNVKRSIDGELSVDDFIFHLKNFLRKKKINSIEFWGGEPLLYFDEIKQLHKKFVDEFGVNKFWFATNGKLLTDEVADFIIQNKIYVSISYDGDGQSLRGYDLEHDKKVINNLKRLNEKRCLAFLPLMTNLNRNMYAYHEKIKGLIETDKFIIGQFPMLNIVDKKGYENRIPDDYLPTMCQEMYSDYIDGKLKNIKLFKNKAYNFISHLGNKRESSYRVCLASHSKHLSIDIAGNIMACHNFNKGDMYGKDNLYLGNVKDLKLHKKPKVYITDAANKRKRLSCANCLVRHLCNSGCVFQNQEYEKDNCNMHFYYYLAIFGVALSMITNKVVKKIVKE